MSAVSTYESRPGILNSPVEDIYDFVTDIRNFKQFIPAGSFSDIKVDRDSCSFNAGMLGEINLRISEKLNPGHVIFSGYARQVNDFSINLDLKESVKGKSEVKVFLSAAMNPMLKMMAEEPLKQFLNKLIDEMEKFDGWKNRFQGK
ncbi:MAG TPA: SRPBCC family protein [Bacteroidales bacterium]|nr:SRPBCC family protein [Bacteroidales bacterium]HPI69564.1 SRPBCC family protein [Bacteroidales bacterium]HPR73944.1 SRPBCC family protein [Bacteroidales bacterium]